MQSHLTDETLVLIRSKGLSVLLNVARGTAPFALQQPMSMKNFFTAASLALLCQAAAADGYKCQLPDGRVAYQDAPCASGRQQALALPAPGPARTGLGVTETRETPKLSLAFPDIGTRQLLHIVADFAGKTLVFDGAVGGRLSYDRRDVPWDVALADIAERARLAVKVEGNTIRVRPQ